MEKNKIDILVISGPNLNILGDREPEIYGNQKLADIHKHLYKLIKKTDLVLECKQSNSENQIIEWIQKAYKNIQVIIINPAAFTHTSIAILDALKFFDGYIIEIHLSNPYKRESFRHKSYISAISKGIIAGFGSESYIYALQAGINLINMNKNNEK